MATSDSQIDQLKKENRRLNKALMETNSELVDARNEILALEREVKGYEEGESN